MNIYDPYPHLAFDDALRLLSLRYGLERVVSPSTSDDVFVNMPLLSGGTFHAILTWRQAKYLAVNPLRAEDLKSGKLPRDWPDFSSGLG